MPHQVSNEDIEKINGELSLLKAKLSNLDLIGRSLKKRLERIRNQVDT